MRVFVEKCVRLICAGVLTLILFHWRSFAVEIVGRSNENQSDTFFEFRIEYWFHLKVEIVNTNPPNKPSYLPPYSLLFVAPGG